MVILQQILKYMKQVYASWIYILFIVSRYSCNFQSVKAGVGKGHDSARDSDLPG